MSNYLLISLTASEHKEGDGIYALLVVYDTRYPVGSKERTIFSQSMLIPPYVEPTDELTAIAFTAGVMNLLGAVLDKRSERITMQMVPRDQTVPLF